MARSLPSGRIGSSPRSSGAFDSADSALLPVFAAAETVRRLDQIAQRVGVVR